MSKIMLKNVRLSFPSLFERASFNGIEGKYEATFLISKDGNTKAKIDAAIAEALKLAKVKVDPSNFCIKDGDNSDYEGYADNWSFKASRDRRPAVIDSDKSPLTKDDNKLYAGCYVNAVVDIWIQNNSYGKRVNSNLLGVQFVKDGSPFGAGGGNEDVTDDFDDLDDL